MTELTTKEARRRSVAKAMSYRVLGVIGTGIIVFAFTREWVISGGVAIADFLLGIVFYYVHERVWNIIRWGKR